MCVTNLKKRYQAWIKSRKFHPIWLELKDREVQSKFDIKIRNHVFKMIKIAAIMQLGYGTFLRLVYIQKDFSEQAFFIVQYGELSASIVITMLLIRLKLSLVDYALFFLLAMRCIRIFIVMHLIDVSAEGFESIDKKDLSDAIPFIAVPGQILAICNLKFNYLVTLPLTIFSLILVNRSA